MRMLKKSYFGFGANSVVKPTTSKPKPKGCPGCVIVIIGPIKRNDPSMN